MKGVERGRILMGKTPGRRRTRSNLTPSLHPSILPQRAGPAQVDADQVKAAMQALRADMEASRDAARKR